MAYNRNWGKKGGFQPQAGQQPQQKAVDKHKDSEHGRLVATVTPPKVAKFDKEPSININLYNLEPDDVQEIITRLTTLQGKKTAKAWPDKSEPTHLIIKVWEKDADDWLNNSSDLNSIQAVLYKKPQVYDSNEVAHLEDQIATGIEGNLSGDEKKEMLGKTEETAMDMWKRYLDTINDKTTMDALMAYRRMYNEEGLDLVWGIVLSVQNVDLIKSVNPDATFVTTKKNWETMFHRGIKRGATKYPYRIRINNPVSDADFEAAQDKTIWKGQDKSTLPPQVKRELDILAGGGYGYTTISIGYDISDTYLLPNAPEDTFYTKPGRLNNLTGELNKPANDLIAQKAADDAEQGQQPDADGPTEEERRTEMAAEYMRTNAQDLGITPKQSGNNDKDLADMVHEYCLVNSTKKANILKSTNSQIFADNATKIALILTRLALPEIGRFNAQGTYDRTEVPALMTVVYSAVRMLEHNSILKEGIGEWFRNKAEFVKRFWNAFKQCGFKLIGGNKKDAKSAVMESFQKTYKKLNRRYF